METAIRWSSNSTASEQRFLIAEANAGSFKRCKVEAYDGQNLQHETLSTYDKIPRFSAFDWAPSDESLVAVGLWSGEVSVYRIDKTSSGISLPAKHQRNCNAVAFSRTGLLAAGLERVRNDFCLNIWDVSQRHTAVSSPGAGSARTLVEPYRKFASSEAISSIKFSANQPEVLIAGIKGIGVRIYDLRENVGTPSLQFQTSSVHNIAIDPLDENYFACVGMPKETIIQIWDCRSGLPYTAATIGSGSDLNTQEGPVVEYRDPFRTSKLDARADVWSLRYCKGKSGFLGALASNGDFKVFETKHEYSSLTEQYKARQHPDFDIPISNEQSILTKHIHHIEHAYHDNRKGRRENERIVAFDFTNLAGSKGTPCAIILRGDKSINIIELNRAPSALAVSALGSLVVGKAQTSIPSLQKHSNEDPFLTTTIRKFSPQDGGRVGNLLTPTCANRAGAMASQRTDYTDTKSSHIVDGKPRSSRESHERLIDTRHPETKLEVEEALSLFTNTRRRCASGYLFDCEKNIEILQDDPWLQMMWTWIKRAKNNAEDEGMDGDPFDLSFYGVHSIWNNDLDSQRASDKTDNPTYSREFASTVKSLCDKLNLPELQTITSGFPKQRQLCLYTCGLGLTYEDLERTVKQLVQQDQNTKAAALAVIHDQAKLAFQALRTSNSSPAHRELSLALAGYAKDSTDERWDETIRDLVEGIEDPYARAILALVSSGDWHEVLKETSLPLSDRVGIALMYLDDKELTKYINENTAECVKHGDVEGIVLTGLTEQSVPLFENYVRKFSDLQTAVLALSFASPRCFSDPRVDLWRETYRSYLNDWRMFIPRVQFDVQSTKLSATPGSKPNLAPPPRHVTLRCNFCDQALDRNPDNGPPEISTTIFGTHQGSIFGEGKTGTVCPRCGRHLPRCVVCMHWLGMPDPHSRGSVAAAPSRKDQMSKFVSVCRSCWHMSHSGHAEEWFAGHDVCPVPYCKCRCVEVDVGAG